MKKHIELWNGPFGSGRTTALIDKYKKEYCNSCIFITMDGLDIVLKDHYGIESITFSNVVENIGNMVRNRKIFIDNAEVFLSVDGFYPFLEILTGYSEIYLTSTVSSFFNKTTNESISSVFLENIQGIKINTLLLKDNPSIPPGYAEALEKEYGYKE